MSGEKDGGGSAFPGAVDHAAPPGMTLRDWFAGQALAALLARNSAHAVTWRIWREGGEIGDVDSPSYVAATAYEMADAMIAERSK